MLAATHWKGTAQLVEGPHRQVRGEQVAQRLARVQVGAGPHQGAHPGEHGPGEDPLGGQLLPHARAAGPPRPASGRRRRSAPLIAPTDVPTIRSGRIAVLEQGPQHPDLGRAEHSPATEDEGRAAPAGRHPCRCHGGIVPPVHGGAQPRAPGRRPAGAAAAGRPDPDHHSSPCRSESTRRESPFSPCPRGADPATPDTLRSRCISSSVGVGRR